MIQKRPLPNRRECENFEVGDLVVTIGHVDGDPVEIFFSARGPVGHHLDDELHEVGTRLSKRIQYAKGYEAPKMRSRPAAPMGRDAE